MLRISTAWNSNRQHLLRLAIGRYNSTISVEPDLAGELLSEPAAQDGVRNHKNREKKWVDHDEINRALASKDMPKITELFRSYDHAQMRRLANTGISGRLFREVCRQIKNKQSEPGDLTIRETVDKLLKNDATTGWIIGMSIIEDLVTGDSEHALETWVRFVELRKSPLQAVSELNREAAVAALAAYIINCHQTKQPVEPSTAMKLIPLNQNKGSAGQLPLTNEVFQIIGANRLPREYRQIIDKGLKDIRLHFLDPSSTQFLASLPVDRPMELDLKYEEAQMKAAQTGQPLPEIAYGQFIHCYTQCTRIQTAFDIWNRMLAEGVRPRVTAWTALLRAGALSRATPENRVAIVEDLWKKMLTQENPKVTPNSESFAVLLDCYFRMGQEKKALEVFRRIENGVYGPTVIVSIRIFSVVLNGLLALGKLKEAEDLLAKGEKKGLVTNTVAYNTFMRSYIAQGLTEKALNLLEHMNQIKMSPDITTYTHVIDSIFKMAKQANQKHDIEAKIEKLLREMNRFGLKSNTITITTIIRGLVDSCQDIEAARVMFDLMIRKHIRPNHKTFSIIIDGEFSCENGDPEKAVHYLNMLPLYGLPQSTALFNQFINYFSSSGDLPAAYEYLERLSSRGNSPNKYSFYFILQGCLRHENMVLASKVVDKMMKNLPETFDFGDRLPSILGFLRTKGVEIPEKLLTSARKVRSAETQNERAV